MTSSAREQAVFLETIEYKLTSELTIRHLCVTSLRSIEAGAVNAGTAMLIDLQPLVPTTGCEQFIVDGDLRELYHCGCTWNMILLVEKIECMSRAGSFIRVSKG